MSDHALISYAQNGEDVVLWRALGHVHGGVYVDVGGWDPDVDSVTRLFYDRGWRGLIVEPVAELADRFRFRRPRDEVANAAITDDPTADVVVLHQFVGTGLSTVSDEFARQHDRAGLEHEDVTVPARRLDDVLAASALVGDHIHFLKIDVEGAEEQVIRSVDLGRWRPWVLVVEATDPNSTTGNQHKWEPIVLAAGYTLTLFDGLSRFYVSADHPEIAHQLSYPACALDRFEPARQVELAEMVDDLRGRVATLEHHLGAAREQAMRWRNEAVTYWANAVAKAQAGQDEAQQARSESDRLRSQLSRVRGNLREARAERKQLRARLKRMAARIDRLSARIERPAQPEATRRPVRGRLGSAVRKVIRG